MRVKPAGRVASGNPYDVRAVMDPAPSLRPVADPDCRRGAWQLPTASEPLTVIRAPETTR